MSDTNNRLPSHYLYAVSRRSENDKGFWTRIGAAWPNGDGKGYSFRFDLFPASGADIVMREPRAEDRAAEGAGQ